MFLADIRHWPGGGDVGFWSASLAGIGLEGGKASVRRLEGYGGRPPGRPKPWVTFFRVWGALPKVLHI